MFRFYHWQQILSVVFLNVTDLTSFSRKSLLCIYVWITSLFFFQEKVVFHWKEASRAPNSVTSAFPRNHCAWGYWEVLSADLFFLFTKYSWFYFYYFIKNILEPGVVAHICNPTIRGVEEEDLEFSWRSGLGYMRSCLNKTGETFLGQLTFFLSHQWTTFQN